MSKFYEDGKSFIIAEAGVNHNGELKLALKMIDSAAEAGVDAVKFQTFNAEKLVSTLAPKARYQKETTGSKESQLDMLKKLELPESIYPELIQRCSEKNIIFMSTPFDCEAVDFLDNLEMKIFKIPSGELTNLQLLKCVAEKMKPIILSTGMAEIFEIEKALECIYEKGNTDVVLLQCTSNYPVNFEDVNLRSMHYLKDKFSIKTGFSDHTEGIEVAIAAATLGATVIEKHFTLDKTFPGPDHRMSLEPNELRMMVRQIRNVEKALGKYHKAPVLSERNTAEVARKSIFYKKNLKQGAILKESDIEMKRPGTGISPMELEKFLGRVLLKDIIKDTMLNLEDFE
jgi:N,N'-diacetyllegionaminate synthase